MTSAYGWDHAKARRRLLPQAYGQPCPMCGRVMVQGQALDLDHTLPLIRGGTGVGDRIVHARCNRAAGARIANRRRRVRRLMVTSRAW